MSRPIIYGVDGSPYVYAARLGLEEKGVDYEFVRMRFEESKQPAHLARQPFGRIPAFEHDGLALYETQAILRYTDRAFPGPVLQPADARACARMDQMMNVVDWYVFPQVSVAIVFERLVKQRLFGTPPDETAIAAALPKARRCIAEVERLIGSGPYVAGEHLSLGDLLLAPHIGYLFMTPEGAELAKAYPRLASWHARMQARDSLARARPQAA
jgi:glutathione S-transferase